MSICIFKDDTGPKGAKYKRHNIDKTTELCKRCKKPKFIKTKKEKS